MLNHSQQQDEAARLSAANVNQHHIAGPTSPNINHHHQVHMGNNLHMKMQQAQYQQQQQKQLEMLNKLINATTVGTSAVNQMRSSPSVHDIGAQSRELLSRPEAQAILQGRGLSWSTSLLKFAMSNTKVVEFYSNATSFFGCFKRHTDLAVYFIWWDTLYVILKFQDFK